MDGFFIDKLGADDSNEECENKISKSNPNESSELLIKGLFDEFQCDLTPCKTTKTSKNNGFNLESTYFNSGFKSPHASEGIFSLSDKVLEKSNIKYGLEKYHFVASEKSKKDLKLQRKKVKEKTKGKEWFNMPATQITKEIKTDFELLKMRSVLDKSHVYKKNDITNIPKYFQVGKVLETPADFYGSRIPKSQRKKTLIDELLADAEFKKYQKKKFKEIMDVNRHKKFIRKTSNSSTKKKNVKLKK